MTAEYLQKYLIWELLGMQHELNALRAQKETLISQEYTTRFNRLLGLACAIYPSDTDLSSLFLKHTTKLAVLDKLQQRTTQLFEHLQPPILLSTSQ